MKQARKNGDVEEIEIPEIKHVKLRIILAIFFLVVSVVSLTYSLSSCVMVENGWREISAEAEETNCSGEFVFQYNIGYNGASASVEYNELRELYTDAMVTAYQVFNADRNFVIKIKNRRSRNVKRKNSNRDRRNPRNRLCHCGKVS